MKTQTISRGIRVALLLSMLIPWNTWAWGRRGHQIVGETAAILVSDQPNTGFMRSHSFDFGYYANVPDLIWKRPAHYDVEKSQHYMDLELFHREFEKRPDVTAPFSLSRKEFESKFPELTQDTGRAFWRAREFYEKLEAITKQLWDLKDDEGATRQSLQEKWLLTAGLMAHYIGDLSMPLHVSENYNGKSTGQVGIHSYFEDVMVDELYPEIGLEVNHEAKKLWPAYTKKNGTKTISELLDQLTEHSFKEIPRLLALDKKSKRENIKKNAEAYHSMIRSRLVDSSLMLAELYRRQLGWKFDDNRFYFYSGEPEYVIPGVQVDVPPATESKTTNSKSPSP
jgi:hypothetical protein